MQGEAAPLGLPPQEQPVAFALVTEGEVLANPQPLEVQAGLEPIQEFAGADARQRFIESLGDDVVDAEGRKTRRLLLRQRDVESRAPRPQHDRRVRVEGDHGRRQPLRPTLFDQRPDERLMAEMKPVERSDRQDAGGERDFRQVVIHRHRNEGSMAGRLRQEDLARMPQLAVVHRLEDRNELSASVDRFGHPG